MPQALPAIIGLVATVGGDLIGNAFRPGMPKPPNPNAVTPQQFSAEKAAVGQQAPSLQSQVGGSVSPEYYLQMLQQNAGTAGQPGSNAATQEVVNSLFNLGPGTGGTSTGLTSSKGTTSGGLTAGGPGAGGDDIVSRGLSDLMRQFGTGGGGGRSPYDYAVATG